jgi:hypothetical protein
MNPSVVAILPLNSRIYAKVTNTRRCYAARSVHFYGGVIWQGLFSEQVNDLSSFACDSIRLH